MEQNWVKTGPLLLKILDSPISMDSCIVQCKEYGDSHNIETPITITFIFFLLVHISLSLSHWPSTFKTITFTFCFAVLFLNKCLESSWQRHGGGVGALANATSLRYAVGKISPDMLPTIRYACKSRNLYKTSSIMIKWRYSSANLKNFLEIG